MKKFFSLCLSSVLLLSFIVSPGSSQEVKDILEKMIEAQGGRKVLESIQDTTLKSSMEMIQMGLSGTLTIYHKEPNKMRWDAEVMGTVITQSYDGETAWMINAQTGNTEEMPERAAKDFKRGAFGNDLLLNPEKIGLTWAYKDKEKIKGKDYLVLEQTFSDGHKGTIYLDPETYLTYKTKTTTYNPMGVEVEAETLVSDYKKVDGVMIAHSITIFQDGEEFMKITITEVSFNSGLEDSFFRMRE